jgi:hypothetical protein
MFCRLDEFQRRGISRVRAQRRDSSGAMTVQQDGGNLPPFFIERSLRMGLVRALVPVAGIFRVTLFAVEKGVDPCRLPALLVLGNLVSAFEISPAIPPESLQQRGQGRRRHLLA